MNHPSHPPFPGGLSGRVWTVLLAWLLWSWLVAPLAGMAEEASVPEAQVKAAFLVNFPKYVEWPAASFAETNSPLVVAVLGETELLGPLRTMLQNRTINGRVLVLRLIKTEEECASGCHILFIAAGERRRLASVLERLRAQAVLTVGETDNFLERGGVINLDRRDQKVRLVVNLEAAHAAGLKISSKLLSAAEVSHGKAPR